MAEDARGDPRIRAVAQRLFEKFRGDVWSTWTPPRQKKVSGLEHEPFWEKAIFFDLDLWKKTANGNLTRIAITPRGPYRVVLFQHKRRPTFGFMTICLETDVKELSDGWFNTQAEAQLAAWCHLRMT